MSRIGEINRKLRKEVYLYLQAISIGEIDTDAFNPQYAIVQYNKLVKVRYKNLMKIIGGRKI